MQDLNDKATGDTLTAAQWNQVPSELQAVIEALGITLSGADLNQLGKAIAGYVAGGQYYTDSGAADAYVLTTVGTKQVPPAYATGDMIVWVAGNANTGGACTVNAGGLGVKTVVDDATGAAPLAGRIPTTTLSRAFYDGTVFRLLQPSLLNYKTHFTTTVAAGTDVLVTPWVILEATGIAGEIRVTWNTAASTTIYATHRAGSTAVWTAATLTSGLPSTDIAVGSGLSGDIHIVDPVNHWTAFIRANIPTGVEMYLHVDWTE